MLGGKFRDRVRMYCDTDARDRTAATMAEALKKRLAMGFTFAKMDLGIGILFGVEGALNAPLGYLDELETIASAHRGSSGQAGEERRRRRNAWYDSVNVPHPFTGIHVTEKGLDLIEQFMADVRSAVGYDVPIALDHFGHIALEDCIQIAHRLEKYNPAWLEDMIPWQYTGQYLRLSQSTTCPIGTGEDIYLKENFRPLLEQRAVAVIHPDILTAGGMLETKKVADMAEECGVAFALHMAESPIGLMAAVHVAAASPNIMAVEFHSADCPWYEDLVTGPPRPVIKDGFVTVPAAPGLGIETLNDEVIAEHIHPDIPGLWEATDEWNDRWAHDRLWS